MYIYTYIYICVCVCVCVCVYIHIHIHTYIYIYVYICIYIYIGLPLCIPCIRNVTSSASSPRCCDRSTRCHPCLVNKYTYTHALCYSMRQDPGLTRLSRMHSVCQDFYGLTRYIYMCIYIYIHTYISTCIYMHIYISG